MDLAHKATLTYHTVNLIFHGGNGDRYMMTTGNHGQCMCNLLQAQWDYSDGKLMRYDQMLKTNWAL